MTNREIYAALREAGMTAEGACGTIANMAAESAMRPDNAQDSCGFDDAAYTAQTDNGLNDFVSDGVGYGLCQWTERGRKQKLLAYAKNTGVSVGDPRMQVSFCVIEMQIDFPSVWAVVTTSHDLLQCTQTVLNAYENPAVKNLGTRMEYARQAYAYFGEPPQSASLTAPPKGEPSEGADFAGVLSLLTAYLGTEAFAAGFQEFIESGAVE